MDTEKIKSIIESILFVNGDPIKISRLAKIIGVSRPETENALMILKNELTSEARGIVIIQKEDEIQLVSHPDNASWTEKLLKNELQTPLSGAALEVLSIVAYRGPISRIEIESIRGVNCTFTLRNLMMKGLLERVENPSDTRGYLYKISFEFMKKLGISNVKELPDYQKMSQDERIDSVIDNEIR